MSFRFYEKTKLERGELLQKPPYGYKAALVDGDKKVTVVEEEASIVRLIFELYLSDKYSIRQLIEEIEDRVGERFTRSHLALMLKNQFYFGMMRYRGKYFKHNLQTFITKETFDRVQEILGSRSTRGFKNLSYTQYRFRYSHTFLCGECGGTLRGFYTNGVIYYRCNQTKRSHHATAIQEKEISAILLKKVGRM